MNIELIKLQKVETPETKRAGVELFVKRLDQIHPHVSGNKYYKLKYNLEEAKRLGHHTLLTFGGAFSNHIYATAAAAKIEGFKSIGLIRGEENFPLNSTLSFVKEQGMQLVYISREQYRKKQETEFIKQLHQHYGEFYLIPEGGTNNLAIRGTQEILTENDKNMDFIICSSGTGGTAAGLILTDNRKGKIVVLPSLKGFFMEEEIKKLLPHNPENWEVINDYHFGGYGKFSPELLQFIDSIEQQYNLPFDPVYTGKAFYGLMDLISRNYFPVNSKILFLHTGGLQGKRKY